MINAIRKFPKIYFLAISLVLPLGLIGCAPSKIILHPLTGADIYDGTKKGDICFSEYYLNNVMKVKIENSK